MEFLHLAVLAIVQGVTEFLPISSSGHLILVPWLFDWRDQGLIIDVAVHVGTLGAVIVYLWRDLWGMTAGLARALTGRPDPRARMVWYLAVASVPVCAAGLAVATWGGDGLRSPALIGWTTLIFGLVLGVADRFGLTVRRMDHMTLNSAAFIGLAQVLSLLPGTSRSGITMTAARMLGFERTESARFSMLLSIPTILGAGLIEGMKLMESGDLALRADAIMAVGLAFVTALVAIALMMSWLRRATFTPFVAYRLILGVAILAWVYAL